MDIENHIHCKKCGQGIHKACFEDGVLYAIQNQSYNEQFCLACLVEAGIQYYTNTKKEE